VLGSGVVAGYDRVYVMRDYTDLIADAPTLVGWLTAFACMSERPAGCRATTTTWPAGSSMR